MITCNHFALQAAATYLALVATTTLCVANQRRDPTTKAPALAEYPPIPKTEAEKKILSPLDGATKTGELYQNVPVVDGRMLRQLAEAVGGKNVVEIGTSTGLSALWICMALEKNGGKLTTFERDPHRALSLANTSSKQQSISSSQ